MPCRTGLKLNLKQCEEIRANMYRSKDCKRDYQAEEVDSRYWELKRKQDDAFFEKLLRHHGLISGVCDE